MPSRRLSQPCTVLGASGVLHLVLAVLCSLPCVVQGKCTFPQFLRRTQKGEQHWLTEVVYKDGTTAWERYINVTVQKTDILASLIHTGECNHGPAPCQTIQRIYTMECIQERQGKYIVNRQDQAGGSPRRMCYRFQQINTNVVQIWYSDAVGAGICTDFNMYRDEWPWIAQSQDEWDYCPAHGGFDFRAFVPIRNEQVCPDEWTPNRMESECVLGEGFTVRYPSTECSPFQDKNTSLHLLCWAHWMEGDYLFVLAAQPTKWPQFVFRLDKRMNMDLSNLTTPSVFESHMYFSPVAPLTSNGLSIKNPRIQQYRLVMRRSDAGICYDESEKCIQYAREGKCSTGHSLLHEDANHCKRSCGMCNFLPTFREECHFSDDIQGEWVWYERDRKENIQVSGGFIGFSRIGGFICKGKHWDGSDYKLFSYYKNGCRPRYTCMRMLSLLDDKKIEFQLSKSSLSDQSFTLCEHFEDDPPPIGDAVRSKVPKLLIPQKQTKSNTCGLNGNIRVSMTTGRGARRRVCHGTVSDWNSDSCGSYSTLTVKLQGKCSVANPMTLMYEEQFICDSYVMLEEDYSLLITKSTRGKETYSCWIIKTYAERMSYRPWKHAYLLDRAQCGRASDFDPGVLKGSRLALDVDSENLKRPCVQKPRFTGQPAVVFSKDVNNHRQHHYNANANNNNNRNNNDDGAYDINPQSNLRLQQNAASRTIAVPSYLLHLAFTASCILSSSLGASIPDQS